MNENESRATVSVWPAREMKILFAPLDNGRAFVSINDEHVDITIFFGDHAGQERLSHGTFMDRINDAYDKYREELEEKEESE